MNDIYITVSTIFVVRKKLCDICSMTPVTFVFFNINQELPQSFGGYTFSFEVSSAAESKH